MEAAAPPPYYITNKRGKKVHNPEHIEYMNTKYSSDNTNNNGVDTSTNTPHKYIKDPDTGEVIENPAYRRAMGLEEAPSKAHHQKSTLLDSVRQGTGSAAAAKTNKDTTNSSAGGGYIVDLSNDFQKQSDHLQNPGSKLLELDFKKFKEVRRCTVIENGIVVADYTAKGVKPTSTYNLFSASKTCTSMLMGVLISQPEVDLTVKDTLGDIFQHNPDAWCRFGEVDRKEYEYKKSIRLEEILTMTSGLESMMGVKGIMHMEKLSVADASGSSLAKALAAPQWDPKRRGRFHYMPSSNILSYIIKEKSGLSPREFADKYVYKHLGIHHDEMKWDKNSDGIETSYSQLQLTTMHMCKIGQLYLQDGYHSPQAVSPLMNEKWMDDSWSHHIFAAGFEDCWYGYLWLNYDKDFHGIQSFKDGSCWFASGFNGQKIGICRETNRVVAISRTPIPPITGKDLAHYNKCVVALLSPTRDYKPLSTGPEAVPPKYVRNPRTGKMMRNPVHDRFMEQKKYQSEALGERPQVSANGKISGRRNSYQPDLNPYT